MLAVKLDVMANEEEMENFGVSERDYYDALRPGERRYKKMTKNQQIYGVFNDDEEDERPSSSRDRFSSKKQKGNDSTTPLQFVKGGIQQQPKQEAKETKTRLVDFSERWDLLSILNLKLIFQLIWFLTVMKNIKVILVQEMKKSSVP